MKSPLILAVALVAFAANASDAVRFASLVGVAALDVAVLAWALGGRRS